MAIAAGDRTPKTPEENALVDAYRDLLENEIVPVNQFDKDNMTKYLAYYQSFSSNVNSDLKVSVLKIQDLSFQDFFSAVTKKVEDLNENEQIMCTLRYQHKKLLQLLENRPKPVKHPKIVLKPPS